MASLVLSSRLAKEFLALDPLLADVLLFVNDIWPVDHLVVTSIHRTAKENEAAGAKTGIHTVGPPYRAVDLRIRNLGSDYQQVASAIADKVNQRYRYDPARPSLRVAFAKPHGSGPHIHLQSHPASQRGT